MEQMKEKMRTPYIRSRMTTAKIMWYIILALLPAGLYGIWHFGRKAAVIIFLTCISSVLTELIFQKLTKKPVTVRDSRSLMMGLVMSYCLPPTAEWYVAVLAGVLCALIMQLSQHFFAKNAVSPVLLTRLVLMGIFAEQMSDYVLDGLTMATPLAVLKNDGVVDTLAMIFGNTGGCIGETSAFLLCCGAIFLIAVGIMDFRVSGMYLFSFAVFMALFGGEGLSSYYLTAQLSGGGLMLALWFIAPEYSTLPITKGGRWIYGIVLGVLTGIFRLYGSSAENLCAAILIANLLVPVIEKITIRRPFGVEKGQL